MPDLFHGSVDVAAKENMFIANRHTLFLWGSLKFWSGTTRIRHQKPEFDQLFFNSMHTNILQVVGRY